MHCTGSTTAFSLLLHDQGIPQKPCTDVASNLLAIDLRLDVCIACDGLQQKLKHV